MISQFILPYPTRYYCSSASTLVLTNPPPPAGITPSLLHPTSLASFVVKKTVEIIVLIFAGDPPRSHGRCAQPCPSSAQWPTTTPASVPQSLKCHTPSTTVNSSRSRKRHDLENPPVFAETPVRRIMPGSISLISLRSARLSRRPWIKRTLPTMSLQSSSPRSLRMSSSS